MIKKVRPTDAYLGERGVNTWPVWEKEVSRFEWHYDSAEECYVLEGEVTVQTADGSVDIGPGDFVIFPAGLDCVWEVKKHIRKHYNFPD